MEYSGIMYLCQYKKLYFNVLGMNYLQKLRRQYGYSQDFVARKLEISRPTYILLESGKRDLSIREARILSDLYGLALVDFLAEIMPEEGETVNLMVKESGAEYKSDMRVAVPQENVEKFREVILYILEKIGARPNIGEAVIWKLLYFIDFDYYEKYEEQLIGARYKRNHHGPTPVISTQILEQMEKQGDIVRVNTKYFQYEQKKYLPVRKADLSILSAQEKTLIDEEIERFKNYNAAQIREYSHRDVPWITTPSQAEIDYESVFYRTPEFSVRAYSEDDES
jgi:transcriptional regulator with XRE-family HTH domain